EKGCFDRWGLGCLACSSFSSFFNSSAGIPAARASQFFKTKNGRRCWAGYAELRLFEVASLPGGLDHVASVIVNTDRSIGNQIAAAMIFTVVELRKGRCS